MQDEDEAEGMDKRADHDSDSEAESPAVQEGGEWVLEEGDAPPVPPEMTPAVSGELNVSVKDFYQRFLSDPVGPLMLGG